MKTTNRPHTLPESAVTRQQAEAALRRFGEGATIREVDRELRIGLMATRALYFTGRLLGLFVPPPIVAEARDCPCGVAADLTCAGWCSACYQAARRNGVCACGRAKRVRSACPCVDAVETKHVRA